VRSASKLNDRANESKLDPCSKRKKTCLPQRRTVKRTEFPLLAVDESGEPSAESSSLETVVEVVLSRTERAVVVVVALTDATRVVE